MKPSLRLALLLSVATGCISADDDTTAPPTWEVFLERSTGHAGDGQPIYTVDDDQQVTLDQLHAYYDEHVAERAGVITPYAIVNVVSGHDDIWINGQQLDLTYCVSDEFGAKKARAVNEIATAAAAWNASGSVKFVHHPEHDAACSLANTGVVFVVRPWTAPVWHSGAASFYPSAAHVFWIDFHQIDTDTFRYTEFPNVTSVGLIRHELGHILGLRHENLHGADQADSCDENVVWNALTAYDPLSAMHNLRVGTITCAASSATKLDVTAKDLLGLNELYGPRPARPVAQAEYLGCNQGAPLFELRWHKVRGVPATKYDLDIRRGPGAPWQPLYDGNLTSVIYKGGDGRKDTARVRACNAAGCGVFETVSVNAECTDVPQ